MVSGLLILGEATVNSIHADQFLYCGVTLFHEQRTMTLVYRISHTIANNYVHSCTGLVNVKIMHSTMKSATTLPAFTTSL